MPFDWTSGPLATGLACYCAGEFFEAHEHWESVWLQCSEPEKTLLQSLIQISAAFHHFARGNRVGARSLLLRSLRRLERYPEEFGGIAVGDLRESLTVWLRVLESDAPTELPDYPRIA
jgi:predicted metal-dependent hydrolase